MSILEKAWAKVHGSYCKTVDGSQEAAFAMLTNKPSEIVQFRRTKLGADKLFTKIEETIKRTIFITANTPSRNGYSKGILNNHSYVVLDVSSFQYKAQLVRLVKLRNPWGGDSWAGEWSPDSELWTDKLIQEVKSNPSHKK